MEAAVTRVLERDGVRALQYSNTEGYMRRCASSSPTATPPRAWSTPPMSIIITNGSQQALDMVAACLVDPGDEIVVETPELPRRAPDLPPLRPPKVLSVGLNEDGIDCGRSSRRLLAEHDPKFIYVIPNFQNPTGLTYTQAVREQRRRDTQEERPPRRGGQPPTASCASAARAARPSPRCSASRSASWAPSPR